MSPNDEHADARPIFISHSHRDGKLVDALVNMLKTGVGLRDEDFFRSGRPGTEAKPGENFVERLRQELIGTDLVVEVVTPSYLDSMYCAYELGALWAARTNNFPILVPPVTHDELAGILGHVQASYLEDGIDDLADKVAEATGRRGKRSSWTMARRRFLREWQTLKHYVPGRRQVSLEQHQLVADQVAELKKRLDETVNNFRAAAQLGEKHNHFLTTFPELIRGLNRVIHTPDAELQTSVSKLELLVADRAAHLYHRQDLRSVIWREQDGVLRTGEWAGNWDTKQPELDADRERRLYSGPFKNRKPMWVDNSADPKHAEIVPLGPDDKEYPSFLLVPIVAEQRNYGLLQLEASRSSPLLQEDLTVVSRLAEILATGFAVQTQMRSRQAGS